MKTANLSRNKDQGSALIGVLILMLIVTAAIASLAAYVTQSVRIADRRADATAAIQFAQGGAAVGADDLNKALTNSANTMFKNLTSGSNAYTFNGVGTDGIRSYTKSVTSPFSNQTVAVELQITNSTVPSDAAIKCTATVGDVTQTATLHVRLAFGFGAAIISDSPGSTATGTSKGDAQDGNVVVDGGNGLATVVDGGNGLAIWANGRANVDTSANVPASSILAQTYGTGNQIPDYTAEGSVDQLFDFARFIAVADVNGTHYTNLDGFIKANNVASSNAALGALEGVIVVNIWKSDKRFGDLTPSDLPKGINIRGTLVFNFSPEFDGNDKIINTSDMFINKADLSGLNRTNPATYTTGYPPTYVNPAKKPSNVDISGRGFDNFGPNDDLPALMYNVGILDIHGDANICGVVYSPSFMEIENKQNGQIQYFKGSLIGGGGIFFANQSSATSICSYDPKALDLLATSAAKGKRVISTYWE